MTNLSARLCPQCGAPMVVGACPRCSYRKPKEHAIHWEGCAGGGSASTAPTLTLANSTGAFDDANGVDTLTVAGVVVPSGSRIVGVIDNTQFGSLTSFKAGTVDFVEDLGGQQGSGAPGPFTSIWTTPPMAAGTYSVTVNWTNTGPGAGSAALVVLVMGASAGADAANSASGSSGIAATAGSHSTTVPQTRVIFAVGDFEPKGQTPTIAGYSILANDGSSGGLNDSQLTVATKTLPAIGIPSGSATLLSSNNWACVAVAFKP